MLSEYVALFKRYDFNASWFERNYDDLVKHFNREFVAVFEGKVVDHDRNLSKLVQRVRSSYPVEEVFVDYVSSEKLEFIL
mgnify:CR=1 FL=1